VRHYQRNRCAISIGTGAPFGPEGAHRLLQLCAFNATLICDEDGLYDPCTINDRLLLGL
jgi:hypothetical protein